MEVIAKGAEAVITLEGDSVRKERVKKSYRIKELDDRIRKQRTSLEASLLDKARRAGISVPLVKGQEASILILEYINGQKLKDALNTLDKKEAEEISKKIGDSAGKLHSSGIIHGDLTTSNLILRGKELCIIDFGLGKFSNRTEDQATDLYLLYEALNSTHFKIRDLCWKNVLDAYMQTSKKAPEVLKRLEEISKSRRYKGD